MVSTGKIVALTAILVSDLLFFLFFGLYYPSVMQLILRTLPYDNNIEGLAIILLGFLVAVSSATALVGVILHDIKELSG